MIKSSSLPVVKRILQTPPKGQLQVRFLSGRPSSNGMAAFFPQKKANAVHASPYTKKSFVMCAL